MYTYTPPPTLTDLYKYIVYIFNAFYCSSSPWSFEFRVIVV